VQAKCEVGDITWTSPSKGTRIYPPENTVAIIVNLVNNPGAIRIFRDESTYIDGVFIDDSDESREIVLWKIGWWFRASGSPQVAYVAKKAEK
jgi:hypothetical protein